MLKRFLITAFITVVTTMIAHAENPRHECRLTKIASLYDAQTIRYLSSIRFESTWFSVTLALHEGPHEVTLTSPTAPAETARIMTGTLIGTPQGDLIQAKAVYLIQGNNEESDLVMSTASPLAYTPRSFEFEADGKLTMTTVTLECRQTH